MTIDRKRVGSMEVMNNKRYHEDIERSTEQNDFNEKFYTSYIQQALDNNNTDQINNLTRKLTLPSSDRDCLTNQDYVIILRYLSKNISKLDNEENSSFIISIINYKFVSINKGEVDTYVHFFKVLISSIPKYISKVINQITEDFKTNKSSSEEEDKDIIKPSHEILRYMINFNPTIISQLPGYFLKHFPHHLADVVVLKSYVSNLLKVIQYNDSLKYDIWKLIIECCIKLDVELQNDLDDLDDEEIDELINGDEDDGEDMDDIDKDDDEKDDDDDDEDDDDDDDSESDYDSSDDEGQEVYAPTTDIKDVKSLVFKLDEILNLLIEHTDKIFVGEDLPIEAMNLHVMFKKLFQSHILPTHFTKSIQFLIFHTTQSNCTLAEDFIVCLTNIIFNPDGSLENKLKSMQYLSSFIARSPVLTKDQILVVVGYLINWLNNYLVEREHEITITGKGGMERFKLFYSVFQGLVYIFCFRYKILNVNEVWELDIDKFFQRIIISKFNPLKFIDETVCFIFAKISTKLNVCYCYSIIENNKREKMINKNNAPQVQMNFKQKQEFLDLQGYFPFDPLVLPSTKSKINKKYIEWSQVNPNIDDDEFGSTDDDD